MFFRKKPDLVKELMNLQAEWDYFNPLIGGWPTRITSASELQTVKTRWHTAFKTADALLKNYPKSIEAKFLLADFLRMGHNIDIPNAAQASQTLLGEILHTDPNHFGAHFSLASLYVSVNPQAAPRAEKLFLKARELVAPKVMPDIDKGLGFACLYQDRIPDAVAYFETYLQLQKDPQFKNWSMASNLERS